MAQSEPTARRRPSCENPRSVTSGVVLPVRVLSGLSVNPGSTAAVGSMTWRSAWTVGSSSARATAAGPAAEGLLGLGGEQPTSAAPETSNGRIRGNWILIAARKKGVS